MGDFFHMVNDQDVESTKENALTKQLYGQMRALMQRYEDPNNFDTARQALDKTKVVTSVMRDHHREGEARLQSGATPSSRLGFPDIFRWRKALLCMMIGAVAV